MNPLKTAECGMLWTVVALAIFLSAWWGYRWAHNLPSPDPNVVARVAAIKVDETRLGAIAKAKEKRRVAALPVQVMRGTCGGQPFKVEVFEPVRE